MIRRRLLIVGMVSVALLAMINFVYAQESGPQAVEAALGTAFTYQGQLKSGGTSPTGSCEMGFRLFDAATLGAQVGSPLTQTVAVNAADCQGQPPLSVHPAARVSGRPFQPELEWQLFDLHRVDTFLAQQV